MRTNYREISMKSIKRDFQKAEPIRYQAPKPQQTDDFVKIIRVEDGDYSKYARFLVGKKVKIKERTPYGIRIEFVFDDDRKALNHEAGWSDRKREYVINGLKVK